MEPARRISNGIHQSHHTKTQLMRICYACTHNAHAIFLQLACHRCSYQAPARELVRMIRVRLRCLSWWTKSPNDLQPSCRPSSLDSSLQASRLESVAKQNLQSRFRFFVFVRSPRGRTRSQIAVRGWIHILFLLSFHVCKWRARRPALLLGQQILAASMDAYACRTRRKTQETVLFLMQTRSPLTVGRKSFHERRPCSRAQQIHFVRVEDQHQSPPGGFPTGVFDVLPRLIHKFSGSQFDDVARFELLDSNLHIGDRASMSSAGLAGCSRLSDRQTDAIGSRCGVLRTPLNEGQSHSSQLRC